MYMYMHEVMHGAIMVLIVFNTSGNSLYTVHVHVHGDVHVHVHGDVSGATCMMHVWCMYIPQAPLPRMFLHIV